MIQPPLQITVVYKLHRSFSSGHSLQPEEIRLGGLGHLLKVALVRGGGFGLKNYDGKLGKGKKMLFQHFN